MELVIESTKIQDAIREALYLDETQYVEKRLYEMLECYIFAFKRDPADIANSIEYVRTLLGLLRALQDEYNPFEFMKEEALV